MSGWDSGVARWCGTISGLDLSAGLHYLRVMREVVFGSDTKSFSTAGCVDICKTI